MSLNVFEEKDLGSFGRLLLRVVEMFRLAHVVRDKGVVTMNNLTLNNYFLYVFGPMREDQLTVKLLTFQMLCSGVAFVLRLTVAGMFYDVVK